MHKAQVQAVSMVLVAGIILVLAGSAYFWGKPLIDKRTTVTDASTAKAFMIELDRQITEVSRSGGTKTVTIPLISGASLEVNEANNEIIYRFITPQAMIDMGQGSTSVPVETYDVSDPGPYGGSPRIIMLQGEPIENDRYLMTLNMTYRTLETSSEPYRGYKIAILDGGRLNTDSAMSRVSVSYIGRTTVAGGCCGSPPDGSGERLETEVNVTIS
jgi:hypothetical protein